MAAPPAQGAFPVQSAEPPLNVANVRLPAEGIVEIASVTYFAVDVLSHGGQTTWMRVQRRYNDFCALEATLRTASPFLARSALQLPPKMWRSCTGDRLEERRRGLEAWLGSVVEHPHCQAGGPWVTHLRPFLKGGRFEAPVDVEQGAAPGSPSGQGSALTVKIPPGVVAGQGVGITVPDGRQVLLIVPEGTQPEAELTLWYDPDFGTLTPMVPTPGGTEQQDGDVVQIQVPEGVFPGNVLSVGVPDGRNVPFTLPADARPGAQLTLWFDPVECTLVNIA